MSKFIYWTDIKRLPTGAPPVYFVICDGVVVGKYKDIEMAIKAKSKNPHYALYRQNALDPGSYYSQDKGLCFISK